MKKNNIFFVLFAISSITTLAFADFDTSWKLMQSEYTRLHNTLSDSGHLELEKQYCHRDWIHNKNEIRSLIFGPSNENVLLNPIIKGTMVRDSFGSPQRHEINFLQNQTSQKTKTQILSYRDPHFSGIPHLCKEFNCSINTLAHLYYAANILENLTNQNTPIITEFGSGYGNLARIFKSIMPDSTLILIDLPELLVLQYLFLKETLPNTPVIIHTEAPIRCTKGAIHLVPVFLAETLKTKSDVFISTFGISETTLDCQRMIINKQFFGADLCFITGQMPGTSNNYVHHSTLHNAVNNYYQTVKNRPSHLQSNSHKLYEIIGSNN